MINRASFLTTCVVALTASLAFAQEADLFLTKSGPDTAAADTDVTYTVTVTNAGPDAAASVTLDDYIPAGMTFVSGTQDSGPTFACSPPALGVINCTLATFPAGDTAQFTFVFHIPPATPGGAPFTNIAVVSSPTDPNDENNTGIAFTTTPLPPQADLSVLKDGPAAAGPDTDIAYTITVSNAGPDAAENLSLDDTLAGTLTLVSLVHESGPALSCTTPAVGFGGTITCTAASYASGATTVYTLTAHVPSGTPSGTTFQNTATVSSDNDPTEENNISTVVTTISSVDVAVSKQGPPTANAGDDLSYTIQVTNDSQDFAINVVLVDELPPNTTFVSVLPDSGPVPICSAPPQGSVGTVTCTWAAFPGGLTSQITLVIEAGNTTLVENTATVTTESFETDSSDNSATASTVISPRANLNVTKSGAASADAGDVTTFTVTVSNNGPSDAANVSLTDNVPADMTFDSITQTSGPSFNCVSGGTITCTIATLAPGAVAVFELTLRVDSGVAAGTILTNTADVATTTTDPNGGDNSDNAAVTVTTSANLDVDKIGPANAIIGEDITYTITVANDGRSDAMTVSLADTLPPEATFVSVTQPSGPTFNCSPPAAGAFTCTIASFAAGLTATFELVVNTAPSTPAGDLTNTATISSATSDPDNSNNSSEATTTITASADLDVDKTGPANATAGTNVIFTVVVTNDGPSDATNVTLTDTLPPNTTFVADDQTSGPPFTCTTPAVGATGTIECTIATLADGASATFTFELAIASSATGSIDNTASLSSATTDPNAGNDEDSASVTLDADADVGVSKTGPATAVAGETVTYTVVVSNNGPSDAVNVTLTDTVAGDLRFEQITQTNGPTFNCTPPAVGSTGTITCTIAALADGASAEFSIVLSVIASATDGSSVTNSATVSAGTTDSNNANDMASSTATVDTSADLDVDKTAPTIVTAGSDITYTIVLTNNGPSDAQSVSLSDDVPAGTTFVSRQQTAGPAFSCTSLSVGGTGTITCTIATLAVGASATFELVVNVPASTADGTIVTNTATGTTTTTDPDASNDSSVTNTTVGVGADVSLTKSGPATVTAGADITYTISVTNAGPSDAATVAITDTLPDDTTFVSLDQTSGPTFSCTTPAVGAAGTVTCTIATLVAGSTADFELVVHLAPNAVGPVENTATVTTPSDPAPANNSFGTSAPVMAADTDVSITKTANGGSFPAGSNVTFTIVVTNSGPGNAENAEVTDVLPSGMTFVSATSTQGSCAGTTTVVCSLGMVLAGDSATITLVAQAPPDGGTIVNTATVAIDNTDSDPSNDSSSVTIVAASSASIPTLSPLMLVMMALALAGWALVRGR